MPLIHEQHAEIRRRFESLTPDARRMWGKMSVGQMLWHVNLAMEMAIGSYQAQPAKGPPIPQWLLKFMVLRMPWPKGAPTGPDFVATQEYDVAAQKARALQLIGALVERPIGGLWPVNPVFGPMTGREWSHLMHKHLDHHLRQFSA